MNELKECTEKMFEDIKHFDEEGNEYWLARELQTALDYKEWRKFENVIYKAKIACNNSNIDINEQFVGIDKLSINVNGGKRIINDYKLSRYACYLIAQNGDPKKEEIAFAQCYFALQTRRAELIAEHLQQIPRLETRDRLRTSEKLLSRNIYERGVDSRGFGRIRSQGDTALFGGYTTEEMKLRFGIKSTRPLADFLPTLTIGQESRNRDDKLQCGTERPLWRTQYNCRTRTKQ